MTTKKILSAITTMCLIGVASNAHAQSHNEVYGSVGTEGIGVGYGYGINQNFGARVEVDGFSFSHNYTAGDLNYSGNVRLLHGALLGDIFPAPQVLPIRITAGLLVGGDQLSGDATSSQGTYTINGVTVPSGGETLHAKIKFPTVRPYVGLGLGHKPNGQKGLSMAFDAGVAIGKPSVSFDVPANIANAAGAENVAAEEQNLREKANRFSVYPIVKISVTYRF